MPTHWTAKHWNTPETKTLMARATAARHAIRHGADPYLALSFVVWPTVKIAEAEDELKDAA